MEAEGLQAAPPKGSSTSSALESNVAYDRAPNAVGASCAYENARQPIMAETPEQTIASQQGDCAHSEEGKTAKPTPDGLHAPSGLSAHHTATKSEPHRPQHSAHTREHKMGDSPSLAPLSRSASYISSSATNQWRDGASSQSAGRTMSYCERLRERLERSRNPGNPHLLEGESIHDRIDAALNPDRHMAIKRCNTQQGQLQYDCDHLRIISGLDMVSAEHCYLTNRGVALADVQSIARRVEYGSIDPVACITGLRCSPNLSAYEAFQRLTTPQASRANKGFKS